MLYICVGGRVTFTTKSKWPTLFCDPHIELNVKAKSSTTGTKAFHICSSYRDAHHPLNSLIDSRNSAQNAAHRAYITAFYTHPVGRFSLKTSQNVNTAYRKPFHFIFSIFDGAFDIKFRGRLQRFLQPSQNNHQTTPPSILPLPSPSPPPSHHWLSSCRPIGWMKI